MSNHVKTLIITWLLVVSVACNYSRREIAQTTERELYLVSLTNCYADSSGTTVRVVIDERYRTTAEGSWSWSNGRELHYARPWVNSVDNETMTRAAIRGVCRINQFWRGSPWVRAGDVVRREDISVESCIAALMNYAECRRP